MEVCGGGDVRGGAAAAGGARRDCTGIGALEGVGGEKQEFLPFGLCVS